MKAKKDLSLFFGVRRLIAAAALVVWISLSTGAAAQSSNFDRPASTVLPVVPQQVRYAGVLPDRAGQTVEAVFRVYADAEGGEPLWTETQQLLVGANGGYAVLLGSVSAQGMPQSVFATGQARWLGVSVEGAPEERRALLASVPYAMKSADAEALAGHPAAEFVTQEQLAQLAALAPRNAAQPAVVTPNVLPPITGSGTTGMVPLWTSASTLGNSMITQRTSGIGINNAAPATTLDVGGATTLRGTVSIPPAGVATTTVGSNSRKFQMSASSWSSTAAAPVQQNFAWEIYASGNNTTSPTGILNFQFGSGANPVISTGLSILSNGRIQFASGQTFPGTGTITGITTSSPLTGSGTSGSVALGLNTAALETTLNAVYPQLATGNIFSSNLEAHDTAGPGNAALIGWGSSGSIGTFGGSDTGYGIQGESTTGKGVFGQVTTPTYGSAGVLGSTGTTFSTSYSSEAGVANAGVWADTSDTGTGVPVALLATADNAFGASIVTNGASYPALYVDNNGGTAAEFTSSSGFGASASTVSGTGLYGITYGGGNGVEGSTSAATEGDAGVLGIGNSTSIVSGTTLMFAGLWGDTGANGTISAAAGVIGTADNNYAGLFVNSSASLPTIYVYNASTGGTGLNVGIFKTFMATSSDGTCGIGSGGSLSCTGQIKSLVSAGGGARTVETYSVQSPENWMEDFGSGELHNGAAVVTIDAAFAETVSGDASYHVFLTPKGDSKGLYVTGETPTSFEVRESGGGSSSLSFDYRIVAKRRGFEAQRLVDVTERFNAEQATALLARGSGIHHKPAELARSPLLPAPNSHMRRAVPGRIPTPRKPMTKPTTPAHP